MTTPIDMVRNGARWLEQQQKLWHSTTVTYRRGVDSVDVSATLGSTLLKLGSDFGGVQIRHTDKDFLISAADLVIAGEQIEPATGDFIDLVEDEGTNRYEVLKYGPQEPEWTWEDDYAIRRRIHAKYHSTL